MRSLSLPRRFASALLFAGITCAGARASAEAPVQQSFFRLPSSNGHTAVIVDLSLGKMTHFREHLFAAEEPLLDASGNEVYAGNQPQMVPTRDILYDAYFGIRAAGDQRWLPGVPADYAASGYAAYAAGKTAGSGVVKMVQKVGDLTATQYFFAPQSLPHAGFVMAMQVKNTGALKVTGISAFTNHNFHMGTGRPGVMEDIGEDNETVIFDGSGGKNDFIERGFAGVVVTRALGGPAHHGASNAGSPPGQNVYAIVNAGGTANLPDLNGAGSTADGWVSAYQFDLGDLDPGESAWVGIASAYKGDPFADAEVRGWLDSYVGANNVSALVDSELNAWKTLQGGLKLAPNLGPKEEILFRQSAVMLKMGQVREDHAYLREWLTKDGELRRTRFGEKLDDAPAKLPATVAHRGKGAMLASLPPGQWTVAWVRDGSYAATALAALGMKTEARDALQYYLTAEAGRFQSWQELSSIPMPPYQISLVRYHGFGVEETDFNDFGPNLEFDGFGLFLWALRNYEVLTGDTTLADDNWDTISTKVAGVLRFLTDPDTGLIRKDSSIWETHWNGRERSWAYSSITAARGLCDASAIAKRRGDMKAAADFETAATVIRQGLVTHLTDAKGALASNMEELQSGADYYDASVLDAIAMGIFDPKGGIAQATLKGLDDHLLAAAGAGWSRNDDRTDHAGGTDVSPWGSEYDSAEWVVTDLRGAVATYLAGDVKRSDRLVNWVRDQSLANFLAISETYDESTGHYKFNAPMLGFGAGVYTLAFYARAGMLTDPACGAYFLEPKNPTSTSSSSGSSGTGAAGGGGNGGTGGNGGSGGNGGIGASNTGGAGNGGSGAKGPAADGGCGCRTAAATNDGAALAMALSGLVFALAFARRKRRG